ncbi:uncharacterized protein LOC116962465 [Tyto alba]|uniref:uncharacterized protein LOC116962465 n=1 Tax=Tyto alba TaxID=56313 RepID=UPI001C67A834|nr:uncharacterized protein LOC116962465 [Tyto alba]
MVSDLSEDKTTLAVDLLYCKYKNSYAFPDRKFGRTTSIKMLLNYGESYIILQSRKYYTKSMRRQVLANLFRGGAGKPVGPVPDRCSGHYLQLPEGRAKEFQPRNEHISDKEGLTATVPTSSRLNLEQRVIAVRSGGFWQLGISAQKLSLRHPRAQSCERWGRRVWPCAGSNASGDALEGRPSPGRNGYLIAASGPPWGTTALSLSSITLASQTGMDDSIWEGISVIA